MIFLVDCETDELCWGATESTPCFVKLTWRKKRGKGIPMDRIGLIKPTGISSHSISLSFSSLSLIVLHEDMRNRNEHPPIQRPNFRIISNRGFNLSNYMDCIHKFLYPWIEIDRKQVRKRRRKIRVTLQTRFFNYIVLSFH